MYPRGRRSKLASRERVMITARGFISLVGSRRYPGYENPFYLLHHDNKPLNPYSWVRPVPARVLTGLSASAFP